MKSFFSDRLLAMSLITAMALVATEVSLWVVLFSVGCILLRWFSEGQKRLYLSKRHTGILSVALLAFVLLQFRTLIGQDPAYTFLLGLTGLKILDFNSERDRKFLILLGFVLLAVKSLFSVDIYWLFPTIFVFLSLWWSLFPISFKNKKKVLLRIFLISAPLALTLFVVFPRFVLPWALNQGQLRGQIGFSEGLQPGSVAELAVQEGLVLRAQFREEKKSSELYWRGAILSVSEGLTWLPGRREVEPLVRLNKEDWDFFVTLEPHQQRYIFVPQGTVELNTVGQGHVRQKGNVFRFAKPLLVAQNYYGWIDHNGSVEEENEGVSKVYLQVPELGKKTQEFLEPIKALNLSEAEILARLQNFFESQGFVYTLQPGKYLGPSALEDFMFDRKKGFCEHFAGAYAILARALGVPARVIVGYQGGTFNPYGNFWSVSQKFAHAWVEVYIDGRWQFIDPTRWVAPLRFEIGAEEFFALSLEEQINFAKNLEWRPQKGVGVEGLNQLSVVMENINYRWTSFLIEFDLNSQKEILREFKFKNILKEYFSILLFAGSILLLVVVYSQRRKKVLNMLTLFKEFEGLLVKRGIVRSITEGPVTYLQRVQNGDRKIAEFCLQFQIRFEDEVYRQQKVSGEELNRLRNQMRDFLAKED